MDGGICINEWLQKHGYLTLKTKPKEITRWTPDMVDWEKQRHGRRWILRRIFINVEGREPHGIISAGDYENVRDELKAQLEAIVDEDGNNINTHVFNLKRSTENAETSHLILIVYFGNLFWRSVEASDTIASIPTKTTPVLTIATTQKWEFISSNPRLIPL